MGEDVKSGSVIFILLA